MLLILFGVLYYITRNYLHGCRKLKVGTHQESCFRDKSLTAQHKFGGKIAPRHVALDSTSEGQEACRGDKMFQGTHTPSCFLPVVQHVPAVESE